MRTVEIKARIRDYNDMITKIIKVIRRTYSIHLLDKFYRTNNGYLILRIFEGNGYASLISYKRSKEEGLQVCTSYGSLLCHQLPLLENILNTSNGILGIVKKERQAFYTEEAQIDVDNVDELGKFVEIKVADKDTEIAKKIVNDLMQKLSITSDDLITESYIDLILEKNSRNQVEKGVSNQVEKDIFIQPEKDISSQFERYLSSLLEKDISS